MRLVRFRIKKYRSIEDSGSIDVDENITTFVGINESGKTNVLRALKKINHVSDTEFNNLTEYPTWHYRDEELDEVFVTATFKLNEEEKEKIRKIDSNIVLDEIEFSKNRNMKLICQLEHKQNTIPFNSFNLKYLNSISLLLKEIDPSFDNGEAHKANLINELDTIKQENQKELDVRQPKILKQIKLKMKQFKIQLNLIPNDKLDKQKINLLFEKINSEVIEDSTDKIENYLLNKIPRFVYFENIGIIDSRIHLPDFIQKLNSNNLDKKDIMAKALLDLGQLDAKELYELSRDGGETKQTQENKDQLDRILDHASKKVSKEIDSLWTSNEHDIEFHVQGDYFRVWVINKKDKTKLQLEERSRGYQWYFSFYTVFSVESEKRYKDAIILLDEPALFLHPKGQEDFLSKILPTLVKKNQILYTTHSPFMVDLKHPDSIHTVTLDEKTISGTTQKISQISNEVWKTDRDALFPLQSALHYDMAQSMFIGKKNLIVEGMSDFWLLSSVSSVLEAAGKIHLKKDIVVVPAGGATRSILFASTYMSQNLDVAVLLDADHEGKTTYELIVKNKILKNKKICMLNEIFEKNIDMSMEDMFPQDYYLKFVKLAYKKELKEKGIIDISLTSQQPMIVKKLETFFKENNLGEFHKSRPDRTIINELSNVEIDSLPNELIKNFEMIFKVINNSVDP